MEEQIRLAAFNWLKRQVELNGEVISRIVLEAGFDFQGERITLIGPAGIWKPRQFELMPISITTVYKGPYNDVISEDGFLSYKYRGTDPNHPNNVGLRMAWKSQTPLIYFMSISPGNYLANFPAYILHDNQTALEFTVALDDQKYLGGSIETDPMNASLEYYRRKYFTTLVEQRAHQQSFRIRVLAAYHSQCCLCKLNHSELLDAAHIIPDTEPLGHPIVPNGLTLCKIHHKAYDVNIIGISPDYTIHIREDILHEIDGPMLKHGIQELNNRKILLPSSKRDYPDRERLDWRYERFLKVV